MLQHIHSSTIIVIGDWIAFADWNVWHVPNSGVTKNKIVFFGYEKQIENAPPEGKCDRLDFYVNFLCFSKVFFFHSSMNFLTKKKMFTGRLAFVL